MRSILTIALKDLRLLSRDRFALFWILVFPLMFALFFGALFGGGGEGGKARIPLAVVDEERSADSARLIERLAAHESLEVEREGQGEAPRLSTLEEARDAVRKGERTAYVRIREGSTISPFALFGGGGGDSSDGPLLEIGIDPSRSAEAGFLQGILMEVVFGGLGETMRDGAAMDAEIARARESVARATDLDEMQKRTFDAFFGSLDTFLDELRSEPENGSSAPAKGFDLDLGGLVELVDVTRERGNRPRSPFEITFPSAMIWGLMSVAMAFALGLTRERTRGTLLRLRIAPLGRAQLLAGKALGCYLACLALMVFLAAFGYAALGVRFGSIPLLVVAMACTAACFTGLMMIASTLGKTEEAVAGAMWGVMMPFAMVGGGMIPLIAMPAWLARLSDFSPFKWGIYAVEGAIWRGFGPSEMLAPCAILVAIGIVFFALGVWLFDRLAD